MRVLFAASEVYPLIKTGGLGDVALGLTTALTAIGTDVRVVLPAYQRALESASGAKHVTTLPATGARVLEWKPPCSGPTVWLIDLPRHFDRPGNPYLTSDGNPWPDNAARFAAFCQAIVELCLDRGRIGWRPDVAHLNDWQTGLAAALLSLHPERPTSLFTIHNLAYQGVFSQAEFIQLGLPAQLFSPEGLEFYGQFSFIKGGLAYADSINTVSPRYAEEIQTPEYGFGLEGLIRHRRSVLSGILNGINYDEWNPSTDHYIPQTFDATRLDLKHRNTSALRKELGLEDNNTLLIGMVGRLVEQKGIDLVLSALPEIMRRPVQIAVLGEGSRSIELQLESAARAFPGKLAVRIGYDEGLAHRIEAGAAAFLMPSRFEPCGLNQLYSLRYGTLPLVRRVGGLADSVVDASPASLASESATGIVFEHANTGAVLSAIDRAIALYRQPDIWLKLQLRGMGIDWSWTRAARSYRELYSQAVRPLRH
jgi:starch synthase